MHGHLDPAAPIVLPEDMSSSFTAGTDCSARLRRTIFEHPTRRIRTMSLAISSCRVRAHIARTPTRWYVSFLQPWESLVVEEARLVASCDWFGSLD